jgi:hypothetical protein
LKDEIEPPVRFCGQACCKDAWKSHKLGHKPIGKVQDSVDSMEAQREAESRQHALSDVLSQKRKVIQQSKALYVSETSAHIDKHKRDEAMIATQVVTITANVATIAAKDVVIEEQVTKQLSMRAQIIDLTEKTETLTGELEISRLDVDIYTSRVVDLETELAFLVSKIGASDAALVAANDQIAALEAAALVAAAAAVAAAAMALSEVIFVCSGHLLTN